MWPWRSSKIDFENAVGWKRQQKPSSHLGRQCIKEHKPWCWISCFKPLLCPLLLVSEWTSIIILPMSHYLHNNSTYYVELQRLSNKIYRYKPQSNKVLLYSTWNYVYLTLYTVVRCNREEFYTDTHMYMHRHIFIYESVSWSAVSDSLTSLCCRGICYAANRIDFCAIYLILLWAGLVITGPDSFYWNS